MTMTDRVEVRREIVGRLECQLEDLEGKVARVMNGPVEIPRDGSPMSDAWDHLVNELGRYVSNFTIHGERLFVKSRRGGAVGGLGTAQSATGVLVDSLDAYLDRYDPGSVNVNDALFAFTADLKAIRRLRDARKSGDLAGLAETVDEYDALSGRSDNVCTMTVDEVLPVGIKEIADRLYVARRTVDSWLNRGIFPVARWTVGGRPAWDWHLDVLPWAKLTSRELNDRARADLEESPTVRPVRFGPGPEPIGMRSVPCSSSSRTVATSRVPRAPASGPRVRVRRPARKPAPCSPLDNKWYAQST